VSRLYEGRPRRRDLFLLIASALVAMAVLALTSNSWNVYFDGFRLWFDTQIDRVSNWF
jgi:hypothetical protein